MVRILCHYGGENSQASAEEVAEPIARDDEERRKELLVDGIGKSEV